MGYVNYEVLQWADKFRVACKLAGCENRSAKIKLVSLYLMRWSSVLVLLFSAVVLYQYSTVISYADCFFELTVAEKETEENEPIITRNLTSN